MAHARNQRCRGCMGTRQSSAITVFIRRLCASDLQSRVPGRRLIAAREPAHPTPQACWASSGVRRLAHFKGERFNIAREKRMLPPYPSGPVLFVRSKWLLIERIQYIPLQ